MRESSERISAASVQQQHSSTSSVHLDPDVAMKTMNVRTSARKAASCKKISTSIL